MKRKAFLAATILSGLMVSLVAGMQVLEVARANPTWGTPATPIPPITDPPQIIITSPNSQEYNNPVPLNITIIQPNSWVTQHNMTLPEPWIDNSDNVVVGQNTLRSITCTIDGHSFTLWNGTYFDFGLTYYLPRVTQFSALMSLSKGQHDLQVNVSAISEYWVEGIIPFAYRTYNISTSQTIKFNVDNNTDSILSPTLYSVKSSYAIWPSQDSTPSPTPTSTDSATETPNPIPSLMPSTPSPSPTPSPTTPTPTESQNTSTNPPTPSPSIPEFPLWILLPALFAGSVLLIALKGAKKR